MNIKNIILSSLIFILILTLSGCSAKQDTNEAKITIDIDGSSTVYPITVAIVKKFLRKFKYYDIQVNVSGTSGGFNKFIEGEIMINNASRAINEQELKKCKENKIKFKSFEIAYDGIAIVTNVDNNWVDYLSVTELQKIWMEGGATKWSDIRKEWPEEPIVCYGPGDDSGTHDYFQDHIIGNDYQMKNNYRKSENDNLLVTGVSSNKYALAFFGMGYYQKNKNDLKLIAVDGGNGAVLPTKETITNKQYHPLSRPMYLYVNEKLIKKEGGMTFLEFYFDHVRDIVTDAGYVPLDPLQYQHNINEL